MGKNGRCSYFLIVCLFVGVFAPWATNAAGEVPGTIPEDWPGGSSPGRSLDSTFFSETGRLALSADGGGSLSPSYVVDVEKPSATASVRAAFLVVATMWGTSLQIPDDVMTLDGLPVAWNDVVSGHGGVLYNHLADVTSIVAPVIDPAPPGRTGMTVSEGAYTSSVDGAGLFVIFDDTSVTTETTVVLLFGSQSAMGDTFDITLASPIDPSQPGVFADMGLAISFGYQESAAPQNSNVEIAGQRLTSSAGGSDDGEPGNGALITVGGLDDSIANPPDPFAPAPNARYDDELYSLLPFIDSSMTNIPVFTENPSSDDNIFVAYFRLSVAAVVGAGIVLAPDTANHPVGGSHTVTATVVDGDGLPLSAVDVTFDVVSGPNSGTTGTGMTDTAGEATFTYTDTAGPGTDVIEASFFDGAATITSNQVRSVWGGTVPVPAFNQYVIIFLGLLVLLTGAVLIRRMSL